MVKFSNLIIRLRRVGRIHYAVYHIVVINKYRKNRGCFVEKVGFYNPNRNEKTLYINLERIGFWLNNGAILHSTVKKRFHWLIK